MKLPDLPIIEITEAVNRELAASGMLVVTAPPGAGKSTVLPLSLLGDGAFGTEAHGKILMLEPRRLAAKQVAHRMANLLGERVGDTVGYRIRHENKVSARTKIEVLTEGVLTRMLIDDPTLEGVDTVIFDEVHERSLQSDLALALTRESRRLVRPDLRILLMSATIDAGALCEALSNDVAGRVKCLESKGRMFPVRIVREEMEVGTAIMRALREEKGDMLVFLPGEYEIRMWPERLSALEDVAVCPLYSNLPAEEQTRALFPSLDGKRKIVLATSIAETSLTIEGIRIVIDSGLCRRPVTDQRTGLSHLQTEQISLDMADQRAGRAGRLEEGVCYRLWSLATEHRMAAMRQPEIEEADLSGLYLSVLAWGEQHPERLPWLTTPPAGHLAAALTMLEKLHAVGAKGLTSVGQQMAQLPCHPRIAAMLLAAKRGADSAAETHVAAQYAAILEDKDPMPQVNTADLSLRLEAIRKQPRLQQSVKRYEAILQGNQPVADGAVLPKGGHNTSLMAAFPERIAVRVGPGVYQLASGGRARLMEDDPLAAEKWLVVPSMDAKSGRIFLAAALSEDAVKTAASEQETIEYDAKGNKMQAWKELRIGSIVLSRTPMAETSALRKKAYTALAELVKKSGVQMLEWNEKAWGLQQRIGFAAKWHPEMNFPSVTDEDIYASADEWLELYLPSPFGVLSKVDMEEVVMSRLTYEQQQALERWAPTHITVPTGSCIRLDYRMGADYPVLKVRLQECFGLLDTPTVDEGRCPVLMELLSPGFKPIQLTRDLASFWSGTYFEVKKELKRRYPKHAWPDDPLSSLPVRGVLRSGQQPANHNQSKSNN